VRLGGRCAVLWGGRRKRSLVGGSRSIHGCLLSAEPADSTEQKPTRTRNSRNGENPGIHNRRPERQIFENGEDPENYKVQENKQNPKTRP